MLTNAVAMKGSGGERERKLDRGFGWLALRLFDDVKTRPRPVRKRV